MFQVHKFYPNGKFCMSKQNISLFKYKHNWKRTELQTKITLRNQINSQFRMASNQPSLSSDKLFRIPFDTHKHQEKKLQFQRLVIVTNQIFFPELKTSDGISPRYYRTGDWQSSSPSNRKVKIFGFIQVPAPSKKLKIINIYCRERKILNYINFWKLLKRAT